MRQGYYLLIVLIAFLFNCGNNYAQTTRCFSAAPVDFAQHSQSPPPLLNQHAQQQLNNLFKKMAGEWRGQTQGIFCSSSKNKSAATADNYSIEVTAYFDRERRAGINNRFDLKATFESDNRESNNELMQYNLTDAQLYFGLRKNNPVIVQSLSNNAVTLIELFPLQLKSGGIAQRIIERRISLNNRHLRIDNRYYTHGKLSSASTWLLSH